MLGPNLIDHLKNLLSDEDLAMDPWRTKPGTFPEILYKYRSFQNHYHLGALKERVLYFASPADFNDPFDSVVAPDLSGSAENHLRSAYATVNKAFPGVGRREQRRRARARVKAARSDPHFAEDFIPDYEQSVQQQFGVFCLAKHPNNILMWSHYGDHHRGFCIGFDVGKLWLSVLREFKLNMLIKESGLESSAGVIDLHKVRYNSDVPIFEWFKIKEREAWIRQYEELLVTKADLWAYEQEYRLVWQRGVARKLTIPADAIVKVVYGCRSSEEDRQRLADALHASSVRPRILLAEKHPHKFGLVLRDVKSS